MDYSPWDHKESDMTEYAVGVNVSSMFNILRSQYISLKKNSFIKLIFIIPSDFHIFNFNNHKDQGENITHTLWI